MRKIGSISYRFTLLMFSMALILSIVSCAGSNPQTKSPPTKFAASAPQYDLVFAVAGDSRVWDPKDLDAGDYWLNTSGHSSEDTAYYKQYINTAALGALRDNLINSWKGSPGLFLMHVGDIGMRGGTPVFNAFKQEMDPLITAGIPVYLTIGNHELRYYKRENNGSKSGQAESNANTYLAQKEYQATIGKSMVPVGAEKFSPQYDGGLAYSFKRGNSLFIALDSYYVNYDDTDNPKYKKGYYSDFQLDKLREILKNISESVQNIFVFSHQPAFNADGGKGEFYNRYHPEDANRSNWILWALLDTYKVDAFFAGHSHFYHRWNVVGTKFGSKWDTDWRAVNSDFPDLKSFVNNYKGNNTKDNKTDWKNVIPQVVNGSCGAPTQNFSGNSVPAAKRASVYNYSIVKVKGDTITIEVYSYGYTQTSKASNGKTVGTNVITQPTLIDQFQKQGGQWQELSSPVQGVQVEDETGAMEDEAEAIEEETAIVDETGA